VRVVGRGGQDCWIGRVKLVLVFMVGFWGTVGGGK
jgi:hypothetical protein